MARRTERITEEKLKFLYAVLPDGTQCSLAYLEAPWKVGDMVTLLWNPSHLGTIVKKISKTKVKVLWSELRENICGPSGDPTLSGGVAPGGDP